MPSDFPQHNLQNAWQSQPTEVFQMSTERLRRIIQQLDRKSRLAVLVSAAIALFLFLFFGWAVVSFPARFQTLDLDPAAAWIVRLGFAVLSLWSLYSGFKTYQVFWPGSKPSDADARTTLQFYRQQLEKRRDYSRNIWLRSGLIFCFLGMAMVVMPMLIRDIAKPQQLLMNVGPILALLIVWLAIFIPQRKRRQRKLQQEIDQLRAFEQEYQL